MNADESDGELEDWRHIVVDGIAYCVSLGSFRIHFEGRENADRDLLYSNEKHRRSLIQQAEGVHAEHGGDPKKPESWTVHDNGRDLVILYNGTMERASMKENKDKQEEQDGKKKDKRFLKKDIAGGPIPSVAPGVSSVLNALNTIGSFLSDGLSACAAGTSLSVADEETLTEAMNNMGAALKSGDAVRMENALRLGMNTVRDFLFSLEEDFHGSEESVGRMIDTKTDQVITPGESEDYRSSKSVLEALDTLQRLAGFGGDDDSGIEDSGNPFANGPKEDKEDKPEDKEDKGKKSEEKEDKAEDDKEDKGDSEDKDSKSDKKKSKPKSSDKKDAKKAEKAIKILKDLLKSEEKEGESHTGDVAQALDLLEKFLSEEKGEGGDGPDAFQGMGLGEDMGIGGEGDVGMGGAPMPLPPKDMGMQVEELPGGIKKIPLVDVEPIPIVASKSEVASGNTAGAIPGFKLFDRVWRKADIDSGEGIGFDPGRIIDFGNKKAIVDWGDSDIPSEEDPKGLVKAVQLDGEEGVFEVSDEQPQEDIPVDTGNLNRSEIEKVLSGLSMSDIIARHSKEKDSESSIVTHVASGKEGKFIARTADGRVMVKVDGKEMAFWPYEVKFNTDTVEA